MVPATFLLLLLLSSLHAVHAALPLVDFDRMGLVGLAGSFAGLDLFNSTSPTFDPGTSTLFSRSSDGSLSQLASTNTGGKILAGCALADVFYLAGSFSSIGGTSAANVASYTPSSHAFAALGSNGPNGEVDSIFCDAKNNKVWVGGRFTSPAPAVAVWDKKANAWSSPPFAGLAGAEGRVLSITTNSSGSSLFFAGSFIASFGGNSSIIVNGTNNPNIPYSPGATPFTSSLVPIPLESAEVDGGPSSSDPNFSEITKILCPAGPDGPGNTWFAADGTEALITVRKFQFISASGVRLGNTFLQGRGTTTFTLTSIPDNAVQPLTYVDPVTGQNQSCTQNCPLSTDSSVLYQDFLFSSTLALTGIQVKVSEYIGAGPGLHILQMLSSGAFASALSDDNGQSCFAPVSSNTSFTGTWTEKVAATDIAGTTQSTLTSLVNVGTPAAQAPSFTWIPYVSASGQYTVNLLVPGCTNFQDCGLRTTVKVTVFPGQGMDPWVTTISQQNQQDAVIPVYNGPIVPSSPDFVATVQMTLADNPVGTGQGGQYELVADRVQMILTSVNSSSSANSTYNTSGSSHSGPNAFGFFEWPLATTSTVDATRGLPNSSETSLDALGFSMFTALGSPALTNSAIAAVVHHPSGIIYAGGNLTLSSGTASGATNIVAFKNGALAALPGNGLNGPVSSLVLVGNRLFVGGSFNDTALPSSQGKLRGIAMYDVSRNLWVPMQAGVDGAVTSMSYLGGRIQVAGTFTTLLDTPTSASGEFVGGFATWDVNLGDWVNSGGYLAGSMTFVGNGSQPSRGAQQTQYVAGNVAASRKFGASGLVMLQNGGSGGPQVTPLGVQLDDSVSTAAEANTTQRRSYVPRGHVTTWLPRIASMFSRQTTDQLVPLPPDQPALAPSVLAGVFWTNVSTSHELVIMGGNFSFTPALGGAEASGVGLYDPTSTTLAALQGAQINGTVRALLVQSNMLFIGGEFSLPGTSVNGFAMYDLAKQQWVVSNLPALQAGSSGAAVVVRSLTASSAQPNTVIVAGSFAQAGSLRCQSICSLNTQSVQWNTLGSGIQGEVAYVDYAGDNQDTLIASGAIALSDNSIANVAKYSFTNSTWSAVGGNSALPGPVTALTVNNRNSSSIFAAGRSYDGSSSYLSFWNGISWVQLGSTLQGTTNVSQLTMVPLQNTHSANGVVEPDRMLMLSGLLSDSSFGNASSALFDGHSFVPYIVTTTPAGTPGSVSSLFHSFSSFSFNQHHFLATGVVILISIAIAAGTVFVLALIGILWTLFSRRDEGLNKLVAEYDEDDDSAQHRPSSLLEHINAATRTTILGANNLFVSENEKTAAVTAAEGPDASNYARAETPSDGVGGIIPGGDEASRPGYARYSFDGTGEGELPLASGMEVEVLDDHDAAWWYVRDSRTGREGVVPASYLY